MVHQVVDAWVVFRVPTFVIVLAAEIVMVVGGAGAGCVLWLERPTSQPARDLSPAATLLQGEGGSVRQGLGWSAALASDGTRYACLYSLRNLIIDEVNKFVSPSARQGSLHSTSSVLVWLCPFHIVRVWASSPTLSLDRCISFVCVSASARLSKNAIPPQCRALGNSVCSYLGVRHAAWRRPGRHNRQ